MPVFQQDKKRALEKLNQSSSSSDEDTEEKKQEAQRSEEFNVSYLDNFPTDIEQLSQ